MIGGSLTDKEYYLLTHPEAWPDRCWLPVVRRGGNAIYHQEDAGIVGRLNVCRVFAGVYLGGSIRDATMLDYPSPEALLAEWEID
jgi:hypothetical protein